MKRDLRLLKLATLTVLMLTTIALAAAHAQNFGGRGPGGPGAGFRLLQAEPVQKELNLTEEQKSSITKLNEELSDLSPEERREKMGETRQKVEAILKAEQKERLEQIGVQLLGGRALTRPEVAKKLGLSEDQRDKLDDLFPPFGGYGTPSAPPRNDDAGGKVGGAKGGDSKAGDARLSPEDLNKKALEVLTAEQRSQFEQMQGKKIDFDPSQFRGGRGQGPGGKGGKGKSGA